ncbi:MAG: PepSY-associated TM helix domain-containing protein [Verrucomicrobiota bacterium]
MKKENPPSKETKIPSVNNRWYTMHSVTGALVLIPLFIICVAGTITFFHKELYAWQSPELRRPVPEAIKAVDVYSGPILQDIPNETMWARVDLPNENYPLIRVQHRIQGQETTRHAIDSATGEEVDSRLISSIFSNKIYGWHYLRPIPGGIYISGFVGLIWFALSITGFWLHRKKLFNQFKGWGSRTGRAFQSWLHTIAATLTLPLHVIYGVTGAVFGLNILALPLVLFIAFGGDQGKMMEDVFGLPSEMVQAEEYASVPDLDPFMAKTYELVPGAKIKDMYIEYPRDLNARMHVHFEDANGGEGEALYSLHKSTEPEMLVMPEDMPAAMQVIMAVFSLHFANFGGMIVRSIYFVGGVFLCVLTYAGTRMWLVKAARKIPKTALITERLFDGFGLGMLPAIAVYALATRLLPVMEDRGQLEVIIFHHSWLAIGFCILAIGTSPIRRQLLASSSVLLLGFIPIIDGLLYNSWPWQATSWHVPSVGYINIFITASVGALIAYRLAKPSKKGRTAEEPQAVFAKTESA